MQSIKKLTKKLVVVLFDEVHPGAGTVSPELRIEDVFRTEAVLSLKNVNADKEPMLMPGCTNEHLGLSRFVTVASYTFDHIRDVPAEPPEPSRYKLRGEAVP